MARSLFTAKLSMQPLFVGALSIILFGCNNANSEPDTSVVTPVKLMEVADITMIQRDSFIAQIEAANRASLSFQVAGEMEQLNVRMGSVVKKGDMLAALDPNDYQLDLDAREAQYSLATTEFERAKLLHDKKLISTDDFDRTQAQYIATKATFEQAQTRLNFTQIRAPFDGVVSIIFAKQHQVVSVNQPVFNLMDNSVLDVTFNVPVSYADKQGLSNISDSELEVSMDSHPDKFISAEFKEISTQADEETNSYKASVMIQRPKTLNLLPGMTGQVHLVNTQAKATIRIPETAWVTKQSGSGTLFRFNPVSTLLETVAVQLSPNGEVVSGLRQGDLIVEAGVDELVSGQQVKAWIKEEGI